MKINGMFYGDNTIKSLNSGKAVGSTSGKKTGTVDSVLLSAPANGKTDSVVLSSDIDTTPRTERIAAAREHIERGDYDSSLREAVAEKVTDSSAVQDVVSEVAMNRGSEASERLDMVTRIREQVAGGYYDDPEVKRIIADRLMNVIGFAGQSSDTL